jgi:hypothetical protein
LRAPGPPCHHPRRRRSRTKTWEVKAEVEAVAEEPGRPRCGLSHCVCGG